MTSVNWDKVFNFSVAESPEFYRACHNDGYDSSNLDQLVPVPDQYNRTCVIDLLIKSLYPESAVPCSDTSKLVHSKMGSTCSTFERQMFQFLYPILMALCLVGNIFNLKIYKYPYFRGANGIQLLKIKAVANMGFVCFLFFEMIHSWGQKQRDINENFRKYEHLYWISRPYALAIVNFCGSLATWFTVFVSLETVLCIWRPVDFKLYFSKSRVNYMILFLTTSALFLQITPVVVWNTELAENTLLEYETGSGRACQQKYQFFAMKLRGGVFYEICEKIYFWFHSVMVLIVPILVMLICSVLTSLCYKRNANLSRAFSVRRKCVLRITFATTISHLVLEGPSVILFLAAAFRGSAASDHTTAFCFTNVATNFLTTTNATVPFFLYVVLNVHFRNMTKLLLCSESEHSRGSTRRRIQRALGHRRRYRSPDDAVSGQPLNSSVTISVGSPRPRSLSAKFKRSLYFRSQQSSRCIDSENYESIFDSSPKPKRRSRNNLGFSQGPSRKSSPANNSTRLSSQALILSDFYASPVLPVRSIPPNNFNNTELLATCV